MNLTKITLTFIFIFTAAQAAMAQKTNTNLQTSGTEKITAFEPEIGKVTKEDDEFKSEYDIILTRTTIAPDLAFSMKIKKSKTKMDAFTRDVVADTAPVEFTFYFVNREKPVTLQKDNEVNFLADGQQITGGKLRDAGNLFKSFKATGEKDSYFLPSIGTLRKLGNARSVKAKIAGTVYEIPKPVLGQIKNFVSEYLK